MISEIGNHYDIFVACGNGSGALTVRRTVDLTEARVSVREDFTSTCIDLDKDEVRKFGEALIRLSEKMERESTLATDD